ncbi:hypothetical protein ACLMJK_003270 [Lecanora helva]
MATLESLSSDITARSIRLSKLLAAKSQPDPTFSAADFSRYSGEDAELRSARQDLLRSARDLASLAESPEDHILSLTWATADAANLAVLVRFSLPQLVPSSSGGISSADLAAKADLPEDVVVRMMRYAVGKGIFEEVETSESGRVFVHNASSALLAKSEYLRDIVSHGTRELSWLMLRVADALESQQKHKQSGNAGGAISKDGPPDAAFNVVFPGEKNVFEFLQKQPALAGRYHKYMVARHNTSRWTIEHMLGAYDWANVGGKTIVDAGGSSGHTVLALSQACPPSTRFIIQDIDPVALEQGKSAVANHPAADRFDFKMHNLFEKQSVPADIYLFRHIFHDWPDADVITMIRNLIPAMAEGVRVLVSEGLVPAKAVKRTNTLDDQLILIEDMVMLASHGARERTAADFVGLFQQADTRLTYVGERGGNNGAFQSLLEFRFQTDPSADLNGNAAVNGLH